MSYIDRLPKDVRDLLGHYICRENWEVLNITANSWVLSVEDMHSINEYMLQFHLRTCFLRAPYHPITLDMHPEDLITDVILDRVIQCIIDTTCFVDAWYLCVVGEINESLEKAGFRLRLITTLRNGKYHTNVIRGYGLLS